MAQRLTTFSKFLITLVIVGAAFFGIKYLLDTTGIAGKIGSDNSENSSSSSNSESRNTSSGSSKDDVIDIAVVTWGGYAGGQYFNEGFKAGQKSRFKKEYGIDVEFQLIDDVVASLEAFKSGDIDIHWYTVDAFPTIAPGLKEFDPVVLWQADWSRGGDAIVARRGINSVAELKGKTVAVAELTPSHSFLIWLLEAGGLTINDIKPVYKASAIDAAEAFKTQSVDAAVVWSPDDEACIKAVNGARVLESTRSASNIIADIFFAKRDWVEANRDKVAKLYEGWMRGAAEINSSPDAKRKAIQILSDGLNIPSDEAEIAINNVPLVTHGDNMNFFGFNSDYKGITADRLYTRMADAYKSLGVIDGAIPTWRAVSFPRIVESTNLTGTENAAEGQKSFAPVSKETGKDLEAIATKQVSINFRSGEFQLDENAKYIIDREFVEIAKAFANARIRIEGNTDNVGSRESNVRLSERRAQAVADYLKQEHNMPANRFIVVGNGPDKPVAENSTDAGKAKNRRTDFELVRE